MYVELKSFFKTSAIYFLGNAINRLGVFVLLPLYTNYLSPEQYGILELVLVTISFFRAFLGMRLGHATLRYFFEYDKKEDQDRLVSTSMIAMIIWCFLLTIILILFSSQFSMFVFHSDKYNMLFMIGMVIMFFEVTIEIPLSYLRSRNLSVLYMFTSVFQLVVRVILNIYIVKYLHQEVGGILIGNLISVFLIWMFLCGYIFKSSGFYFDTSKVRDLWKYSYPLVMASIPGLFLKNIDRIFLGWYSSVEAVGLYALALRFGITLEGFVVEPFQLGYGPFRFSIMKKENANSLYSRILTYFFLLVVFAGLFISLFSREVIKLMSSASFEMAYKVVPLIIASTILSGLNYIFQSGLYIEKRTDYILYISIFSAILNLSSLYLLVPFFGIYGAGISLILTNFSNMILTYLFSQKIYRINFEFIRIWKITGTVCLIYFLSMFINDIGLWERIGVKIFLILLFPIILLLLKFFTKEEINNLLMMKERFKLSSFLSVGEKRM